jgi:hypothetical protein
MSKSPIEKLPKHKRDAVAYVINSLVVNAELVMITDDNAAKAELLRVGFNFSGAESADGSCVLLWVAEKRMYVVCRYRLFPNPEDNGWAVLRFSVEKLALVPNALRVSIVACLYHMGFDGEKAFYDLMKDLSEQTEKLNANISTETR